MKASAKSGREMGDWNMSQQALKPKVFLKVALLGPLRRIYLPKKELPGKRLSPGESFLDAVKSLVGPSSAGHLLGVYSPHLFSLQTNGDFVVSVLATVEKDADTTDWYGERNIPLELEMMDLRIIHDALCFYGCPFAR